MKQATDFKIIFVHGYTSSSKDSWYPNIAKELTKLGIEFAIPNLPGGDHPHASEWLDAIHREVQKTDKPIVFVGHSLGTRAIPLYLEKYQIKVKAVFLIAAFANRLDNARRYDGNGYPDFFAHKIDIESIKPLVGKFIVMHSKDDPLDYEQGLEITCQLGAKLITYEDRGHFDDPESSPFILKVLEKELS
jgi:predicted alpha/beta hydrolase family esterase